MFTEGQRVRILTREELESDQNFEFRMTVWSVPYWVHIPSGETLSTGYYGEVVALSIGAGLGVWAVTHRSDLGTDHFGLHEAFFRPIKQLPQCDCGKDKFRFQYHAKYCPEWTRAMEGK